MPAWGASDCHLGNNPVVLAVPYGNEAIVLDAAMSQFSYGTLESYRRQGEELPVPGGYDARGNLTTDAAAILRTERVLPIGYWKGSGLALLFDMLATILSGGLSTKEITDRGSEHGLSQVFIAVDISQLGNQHIIPQTVNEIIRDYCGSKPADAAAQIRYPGERVLQSRKENLKNGIPVAQMLWDEIIGL
jgi:3-dehydro-L-gulonate 2-dehydrogenase